jgi:DNA-binding NarL/FixJ family response regulator
MSTGRGLKALLLDDDEYAVEYLKAVLLEIYPELEIETRLRPDVTGEFDLYFLDDDFEGIRLAGKLARRIRAINPTAIILAFSASLGPNTLRELLSAGCSGVCDKKVPTDMPTMLAALDRCLDEIEMARTRRKPERTNLLTTLRGLFGEWNRRLESQE